MMSWWQAGSSGALGWWDFMLKEREWICWWTVLSIQAARVWSSVISILCVTNHIEALEFYGMCIYPAVPRIAQTAHTAPLRPFWSCRRLRYLSHCWLIWKHGTHRKLNPVYAVESLSTYRRWLRSTHSSTWTVCVAPELVQKGKKVRRGTLGSKEERFGDHWFVTVTEPVSSVLGPELRQLFGDLSSHPSSFPCSEWQVWFILSRALFLHLQSEQSLNWCTLNLSIL